LAPIVSKSARIFVRRPVSAAITAVTDATPMMIPIVVRNARSLLAQIWPIARTAL
jgi:hypothetical protein